MGSTQTVVHTSVAEAVDRHGAAVYTTARGVTGDDDIAVAISGAVFAAMEDAPTGSRLVHEAHRRAVAHIRRSSRRGDVAPLRLLEGLSQPEAWALYAAYFRGRTYREIAAELGIPPLRSAHLLHEALRHVTQGATRR